MTCLVFRSLASQAFFVPFSHGPPLIRVLLVVLAATMNESAVDSLQNAIVATISSNFLVRAQLPHAVDRQRGTVTLSHRSPKGCIPSLCTRCCCRSDLRLLDSFVLGVQVDRPVYWTRLAVFAINVPIIAIALQVQCDCDEHIITLRRSGT